MSDQPESPRAPRDEAPPTGTEAPRRPLPRIPSLQTLDLGAAGMACDLDDPDCVLPGASATNDSRAEGAEA